MSYQAYIKITTDEFNRVFPPRFRTMREADLYAQHKAEVWPTCEDFGIQEVPLDHNCEWHNGKLQLKGVS